MRIRTPLLPVSAALPGLLLAAGLANAHEPVSEASVVRTHDDPALEWGPCPPFLPEGCAISVLHGDPAGDDADVFFKVPGGAEIPLHWHGSSERMVLVAGELRVTYAGEDEAEMRAGSYGFGPAEKVHSANCVSTEACVLFIAFGAPLDAIAVEATP